MDDHTGVRVVGGNFAQSATAALERARAAAVDIDNHRAQVHLLLEQMTRPRGLGERNREAMNAFGRYVPQAARRAPATAQMRLEDIDAVLAETFLRIVHARTDI
jgi:hypothetical protein